MATGVTDSSITSAAVAITDEDSSSVKGSPSTTLDSGASPKATVGVDETGASTVSGAAVSPSAKADAAVPVADNLYFFEDEIYRIDKKGRVKFGLVLETSETLYSGDEEDDFDDVVGKGEIRVAWHPEGKEEIQPEKMVGLVDRTIMPADVVRRLVPGKDTQRGYCREINMRADVKIVGTKYVVKNVVAERLRLIGQWQRDSAVCLDSWVGTIKGVEETVVLKSSYGSIFEVSSSDLYGFNDVNYRFRRGIFNDPIFYPGQMITGRFHSSDHIKLLTPDIPLKLNKKGKPFAGRYSVESTRTESLWVLWQCKALSEDSDINTSALQQPEPCVKGKNLERLKRLNLFEACMLQINDRNYLKISDSDVICKKSEWDKEQAIKFKYLQKQQEESGTNLFVPCIAPSASTNSNSSHHFEKLKKKLNLLDSDKSSKSKKCTIKMSREKSQEVEKTNETNLSSNSKKLDIICETAESDILTEGWISIDDEEYNEPMVGDESVQNENDDAISSTTTLSTCSSPTPLSSPKHQPNRWKINKIQATKKLKKKLKGTPTTASVPPDNFPKAGDEVVTEALLVYSTATVVWQDGSIETSIPSTQLYPIYHLDTHEFFPGDFVISGKEDSDASFRDYGVVQSVDHLGRIARVKWFTTYTSTDEPKPTYKGETEVSVYDLKDHPDFQYRPGIMVIRVANFVGEDATCTAGQIIDNYTDGRAKVWWVDGHISLCWPQDLFEVGQYDQTDMGGNESDDSWETESENSEFGCSSPQLTIAESHILENIEQARVFIARLEEIFNISPNLQSKEVMRKLLGVYKTCRYLDRLLNTNFFNEENFLGLVEKVRKGGNQSICERAQDRKNRLFNETHTTLSPNSKQQQPQHCYCQAIVAVNVSKKTATNCSSREYAPKVLFNLSSTPFKNSGSSAASSAVNITSSSAHKRMWVPAGGREEKNDPQPPDSTLYNLLSTQSVTTTTTMEAGSINTPSSSPSHVENSPNSGNPYNDEKNRLLSSAMLNIEKAFEKSNQLKATMAGISSQDDSGNYSRNENCDGNSTSYASSSDSTNVDPNSSLPYKAADDQKSISFSSIELADDASSELVCVRLCSLLKDQLEKCVNEIREKYYKEDNINLSELFEYDIEEDITDTIVEPDACIEPPKIANIEALKLPKTTSTDTDTDACVNSVVDPPPPSSSTSLCPVPSECFQVLSYAPKTHKFHLTIFHPNNTQQYFKAVQREHRMLRSSLPPGVWVRVYEDRMDLVSVMIEGPKKTPYEDGMFFFDIQMSNDYPKSPPLCHYISYCSDRLNPNLYEDGKVCVSLLGTWTGRDSEVWGPNSTLLQVIVSIQGLILVPEPYFNEAGYEKQKGTQQGDENSRMYNEMVIIKMVQATSKLLHSTPEVFETEILEHFRKNGMSMYERIKCWMEISNAMRNAIGTESIDKESAIDSNNAAKHQLPDFPLVPASRGFCLTLAGLLDTFKSKLMAINMNTTTQVAGDSVINVD